VKFRRRAAIGTAAAIAAVALSAMLYAQNESCFDGFDFADGPLIERSEAERLLASAKQEYVESRDAVPETPLSAPIGVESVSRRTATLRLAGSMYAGNRQYGEVWRRVYADAHHGKTRCVRLNLVWAHGGVQQLCCYADM
jgi:hypothetical protein